MSSSHILQEGHNCWRICHCDKAAFLIDAAAYFRALYDSLPLAERQVMILSWDIYSKLHLVPELDNTNKTPLPTRLGDLLDYLVKQNRHLHINVLNWDFSLLFSMDRELLPIYKLEWSTHRRLKFCMDDQFPLGASHHQKVIVLDDALAFAGGLDLTRGRWDTSEHRPDDPRRSQVDGTKLPIRPYHDVHMAVTGEVASSLGELARDRWQRGTRKHLKKPAANHHSLWPNGLQPDLRNVDIAIARTIPKYADQQEIREIEQFYIDTIAAAENYIYIENQYFTSPLIAEALEKRLKQDNGPEIILVLPYTTEGWLSQRSMDVIRIQLIRQLRDADKHERFMVYYPHKDDLDSLTINMHAKVLIQDDYIAKVGSSNLNNRSLGLDTECDLIIENTQQDRESRAGIRHFLNRLLGEHLNVTPETVNEAIHEQGSLIKAIESLRGNKRTLEPLEPTLPEIDDRQLRHIKLTDPERPVDSRKLLHEFLPEADKHSAGKRIFFWVLGLLILVGIGLAWRYTPLNDFIQTEYLAEMFNEWKNADVNPAVIILAFTVAGLIMVPITSLIIVLSLIFGPVTGFFYAISGSLLSALAGYGIGSLLGRRIVRDFAGKKINKVSQQLANRGMLTMLVVRIVPVAPFTIINLVAGASHIKFSDFSMGTLLGMTPGIIGIILLTDRVRAALTTPSWSTILTLVLVAVIVLSIGYVLAKTLLRQSKNQQNTPIEKSDKVK